eukprot:TRINITY_DN8606_c0_g1_i1.p1 TRINITY_DN8606_c0_g1~~TRINITY_DN8606_c0_g1_i1.p1  ORF type:complete len:122 (-),score=25.55 TRINITY_DN8606_c0_g1_i1:95-460(-)
MLGIWIAYKAFLLVAGVVMAFLTRNVEKSFNESLILGLNIYNITIISCVGIGIVALILKDSSNITSFYFVRSFVILALGLSSLVIQITPKFFYLGKAGGSSQVPSTFTRTKTGGSSSGSHS